MQGDALQTVLLEALLRVLADKDAGAVGVYRSLLGLATRHHAILLEEPLFGIGRQLCTTVAAEVLGLPVQHITSNPDFLALPSDGQLITKEAMQETTARLVTRPTGDTRVVIWEEIGRFNSSSANAFLKTLEEPDSKTLFLLTTATPERLLPTILSRTIRVELPPQILAAVTEQITLPEALQELSFGRPALAAALHLEESQKDTPITDLLRDGMCTAAHLLSDDPKRHLEAYSAILQYKEQDTRMKKKTATSVLPVRPLQLFCFIVEGTIEKMLHSTMMTTLTPRVREMASRILRFRQDLDQNVGIKLATLDLVFGSPSFRP